MISETVYPVVVPMLWGRHAEIKYNWPKPNDATNRALGYLLTARQIEDTIQGIANTIYSTNSGYAGKIDKATKKVLRELQNAYYDAI